MGLGHTFNYAEMAASLRRVHSWWNAGTMTGWDSMSGGLRICEVHRFYERLGIGGRTTIEYFDGPHTINGKGTFEFLEAFGLAGR